MKIELSKENQQILQKIKQIETLADEINKISAAIKEEIGEDKKAQEKHIVERNLIGGILVAIYSPIGEIGSTFQYGPTVIMNGLLEEIKDKPSFKLPSFLR